MKIPKETELAMLELKVIPQIQEVSKLLQMNKEEEAQKIVERDILGLLLLYRESEDEKYRNAPDNLKSAQRTADMKNYAELFESAIRQFYDIDNEQLLPAKEWNLEAAERYIERVIKS